MIGVKSESNLDTSEELESRPTDVFRVRFPVTEAHLVYPGKVAPSRGLCREMQQTTPLPVISLASHVDISSLATELGRSCREEGFIYLADHGISQELIDKAFDISKRYFAHAQPEDKVDLTANTGYTAV